MLEDKDSKQEVVTLLMGSICNILTAFRTKLSSGLWLFRNCFLLKQLCMVLRPVYISSPKSRTRPTRCFNTEHWLNVHSILYPVARCGWGLWQREVIRFIFDVASVPLEVVLDAFLGRHVNLFYNCSHSETAIMRYTLTFSRACL